GDRTEAGQLLFNNACRTCHTVKQGDNRLRPSLHGIVGRKAGQLANYGYSSALKGPHIVGVKGAPERFIPDPDQAVAGNSMKPFGGLASAEARAPLSAYLESGAGN